MTPGAGWPALEVVGAIDVPDQVLAHRFVIEVAAAVQVVTEADEDGSPVAGTINTGTCELYGWGPNVAPHADNTGFVYLVCLNDGQSLLHAVHQGQGFTAELQRGAVVRLLDSAEHWTEDAGPRVAAFVGSFQRRPVDGRAMAILTAGVDALARGDYYNAPRCSSGFRVVRPDECFVADFGDCSYSLMLLADAKAQDRHIIECSQCGAPATRVDYHWPYFWDDNLCGACSAK